MPNSLWKNNITWSYKEDKNSELEPEVRIVIHFNDYMSIDFGNIYEFRDSLDRLEEIFDHVAKSE